MAIGWPIQKFDGITNIFLIKNGDKSIDGSTFENMLQSFSNRINAHFDSYELGDLSKTQPMICLFLTCLPVLPHYVLFLTQ